MFDKQNIKRIEIKDIKEAKYVQQLPNFIIQNGAIK